MTGHADTELNHPTQACFVAGNPLIHETTRVILLHTLKLLAAELSNYDKVRQTT